MPTTSHNARAVTRKLVSGLFNFFILTAALLAADPPRDLAQRTAARETETEAARSQHAFRQTILIEESNSRGRGGTYSESRDVIFLPNQERSERFVKKPADHLKLLRLTEEDFADIREVQPALFTTEQLRYYRWTARGEETIDGIACWVLDIKPRQILDGQRFFEGLLWIDQRDYSIVRTQGRAVPELVKVKNGEREENLFPAFVTIRARTPQGFWFPVRTVADDTLPFRHGAIRIRMNIRYENYQRFGSDTLIKFEGDRP